jgi:hypothetical protein
MGNYYNDVFAIALGNGTLQYFAIDENFQLWTCWKASKDPNAGWTPLETFPVPIPAGVTSITGGPLPNGEVQLFAVDADRNTWSCWSSSSGWSEWTPF